MYNSQDLIEFLKTFNEEAVVNFEHIVKKGSSAFEHVVEDTLSDVLLGSFTWKDSPQGVLYWNNLYQSILEMEQ